MVASVFMLISIIYLYTHNPDHNFEYAAFVNVVKNSGFSATALEWLFLGFFIAFSVKVPLFPLPTWLPDAHGHAPTAGSVFLAIVLLKMGPYGLSRCTRGR